MEAEQFERYLKRGGRSQSAVARCIMFVTEFEDYLRTSRNGTALEEAEPEDLIEFVKSLDREKKTKSKGYLWAIRYYYTFEDNPELSNLAGLLREERIERKPFLIIGFMGVNQVYIDALAEHDIRNIDQMLVAGATKLQRSSLAERTAIPHASILEIVKLSDLARIPGVKGIRARLYYDAGFDTVEKIAAIEPEKLRAEVVEYARASGFDGVPTLPAEAIYTVEKARTLPIIVEY